MSDIEEFENFISPISLDLVHKSDIQLYLSELINKNLQERSINRKMSSLRSFYNFLLITGTISNSPLSKIRSLKFYSKVQIPYSSKEISNLFESDLFENSFEGRRDKLILEVLYHTGIRRAELIGLKVTDIDLEKREIRVFGKRRKERIIPITQNLVDEIQSYLKYASKEGVRLNTYLFILESGKKLYPEFVYRLTNYYLSHVTEKSRKSPHGFRHSIATHLLNNGAEINAIKEMLGHSSLAATQLYTHNDINQLKKVFNQAHPRESK